MPDDGKTTGFLILIICCLVVFMMAVAALFSPVRAHDPAAHELDQWYSTRKQPDTGISCCGPSDAYFCDEGSVGQQVYCTINDDRDNAALKRIPVANGTRVEIPPHKFNKDPNPTGRAVVWLSSGGHVWCFVGISGS
jgi:hypothetical protein